MRKTIWIARDSDDLGDGDYVICTEKPEVGSGLEGRETMWIIVGHGADYPPDVAEDFLSPADRLKPGEGPKRIKIKLGG